MTGLAVSRVVGMARKHVSNIKIRKTLSGATSFRLLEHYGSNTPILMSELDSPQNAHEDLPLPNLSTDVREALFESALRNGRSVHEEAEHIIRTHLAENGDDQG